MSRQWVERLLRLAYCVSPFRYARRIAPYAFLFLVGCSALPTAVSLQPTINAQLILPQSITALGHIQDSVIPVRDPVLLTSQLRGINASRTVAEPKHYTTGDVESFWYSELSNNLSVEIDAELRYQSDELSMWVEVGERVDQDDLVVAAQEIEATVLPTTRAVFGKEWTPGVDGDPRVHILHVGDLGGVAAAYFAVKDEYVTAVNPFSNEREMLYVNLRSMRPGTSRYLATIAHEMQHLIQWHTDGNEDSWLGEGLSELASELNGFPVEREATYARHPDIQLTTMSHEPTVVSYHYAAATLFTQYSYDRFGQEFMEAVVRHPENGLRGIDAVLDEFGHPFSAEDVFADWLVTNYLTSVGRGEGVHQYDHLQIPELAHTEHGRFPQSQTSTVSQFGADYIELNSDEPLTVVFTGTQQIPFVNTLPHSGDMFYVSLPADSSDVRLTRAFDLTDAASATLSFWTWYDIEAGWDYGYVMVSTDNGRTWELLKSGSTTSDNPFGNSFGEGYTGKSGDGDSPIWIEEIVDLTPYVGNEILLRFSTITDGAVTEAGFVVDDIAIPEIGFFDDAETGAGWQEEGFVRSTAVLPQTFLVQRILIGENDVQIERLLLDENQQGQWVFPMDNHFDRAILILSGLTPMTRETAVYQYKITEIRD